MRELQQSGIPVKDAATGELLHLSVYQLGRAQELNIENGDVVVLQADGTLKCFASDRTYVGQD